MPPSRARGRGLQERRGWRRGGRGGGQEVSEVVDESRERRQRCRHGEGRGECEREEGKNLWFRLYMKLLTGFCA